MNDFVIDQVAWHTGTVGNPETPESTKLRFRAVVRFLQNHGLTSLTILRDGEEIDDAFAIRSGDLTETGLALMKKAYDKWVQRVDRGMDPEDTTLLGRELAKMKK